MNVTNTLSTAFLLLSASACGGATYEVQGDRPATGADAVIEVEEVGNNREVSIQVENLPPPNRVAPGTRRFAVWVVPESREAVYSGILEYDEDERSGDTRVITPHKNFVVLITAEAERQPATPNSEVVFRQRVRT